MGFWNRIKGILKRGRYVMTGQTLTSITDHPRIKMSIGEYERIMTNLMYYESNFGSVKYTNSDNQVMSRDYFSLPLGRTVSKKLATLVFNEQAEIVVDDEVANEFVQETLKNDRFNKNFERYLESCLALGGLAMRPYIDGERVRVSFIQAPVFFPLQSNTQDVSSAAIVSKTITSVGDLKQYYTLIEFHDWSDESYIIENELYKSDRNDSVGTRVPLTSYELYEELEDRVDCLGLTRPLFTYLKTPGMNNKDINSPLGLSIFDNAIKTIDFINRTYDEFAWEVRMGQRRVAVPEQTIRTKFRSDGKQITPINYFPTDQNVFMQIGGGNIDESMGIVDLTTPIRSDDYIKAINKGLSLFEMQVGVSSGMFSFDGKTMKTATEIVSENSDTYQLRNSIVSLVEQSLKELVISILELASHEGLYSGKIPTMDQISVNLDDGVFTDKNAEADYWTKLYASNAIPQYYMIMKILGCTEQEARRMVEEIGQSNIKSQRDDGENAEVDLVGE